MAYNDSFNYFLAHQDELYRQYPTNTLFSWATSSLPYSPLVCDTSEAFFIFAALLFDFCTFATNTN